MWRPRLPRRDPDGYIAAALVVGLPALLLIAGGAPPFSTALVAALVGGFLVVVR